MLHSLKKWGAGDERTWGALPLLSSPIATKVHVEGIRVRIGGCLPPGPRFAWSDGIFLKALRAGDWVLLDELNLASQSVLEGLNACLDHRGTVYIPEIDK